MRVSAIGRWAECEYRTLHEPERAGPELVIGAGAWVGTLAHYHLTSTLVERAGGRRPRPPSAPERIAFDSISPSSTVCQLQARLIHGAVMAQLMQYIAFVDRTETETGLEVHYDVGSERSDVVGASLTGHYDLIASMQLPNGVRRRVLIDLKTGRSVGQGWLQVGGYLQLLADSPRLEVDVRKQVPEWGGIIHCPRKRENQTLNCTIEVRPADELRRAFQSAWQRVQSVVNTGESAVARPGGHCRYCEVDECAVRAVRGPHQSTNCQTTEETQNG